MRAVVEHDQGGVAVPVFNWLSAGRACLVCGTQSMRDARPVLARTERMILSARGKIPPGRVGPGDRARL
ncbi:hypothetical protein PT2222_400022 [Paraburkholderia tropica]